MRRQINTPSVKVAKLREREERAAIVHRGAIDFLASNRPYSGALPHPATMSMHLFNVGWYINDTVEHLEYPGIPLLIVGALTHTKPYEPPPGTPYIMHSATCPYISVVVRLRDGKANSAPRLFNAGKLRQP